MQTTEFEHVERELGQVQTLAELLQEILEASMPLIIVTESCAAQEAAQRLTGAVTRATGDAAALYEAYHRPMRKI